MHQHGEVGKSGPSRWRSRNRSVSAARPASANWVRVACSSSKLSASRRSSRDRNLLAWRDTAALKTSCWNEPSSSRQRRTGLGRAACGRAVAQVGPTPSCVQVAPPGPVGPGSSATLKLTNHSTATVGVTAFQDGRRFRWEGSFLWLGLGYDHLATTDETGPVTITFTVDAAGPAVNMLGPLFAGVYARNLDPCHPATAGHPAITRSGTANVGCSFWRSRRTHRVNLLGASWCGYLRTRRERRQPARIRHGRGGVVSRATARRGAGRRVR